MEVGYALKELSYRLAVVETTKYTLSRLILNAFSKIVRRLYVEKNLSDLPHKVVSLNLVFNDEFLDALKRRSAARHAAECVIQTDRPVTVLFNRIDAYEEKIKNQPEAVQLARHAFGWVDDARRLLTYTIRDSQLAAERYVSNLELKFAGQKMDIPTSDNVIDAIDFLINQAVGCSDCDLLNEPLDSEQAKIYSMIGPENSLGRLMDEFVEPYVLGTLEQVAEELKENKVTANLLDTKGNEDSNVRDLSSLMRRIFKL